MKKEPYKVPSKALKGFAPSSERVDDLMDGKQIPIKNLNKFPVTERALETLEKDMREQDAYGFPKYGEALDYTMPYDWMRMFRQEMADGLKYIQCEMDRKNAITQILRAGMMSDDPKQCIEVALELLTIGGTGK